MGKSIASISNWLTKWYVGASAFIIFLILGLGINLILGDMVKVNEPIPFTNNDIYIPLIQSNANSILIPSRFDISLKFTELTRVKDLGLVLHFVDSSGNTTYWNKADIQLVTNVSESNIFYHRFLTPNDSIWKVSEKYKIYLWNSGQNLGVLNQSEISIR